MLSGIKKEFLVGVIAAIIVIIFVEPIIRWLWGLIIQFSAVTYDGYIDFIYRNAAFGKRNYVDVLLFMSFVSVLLGLLLRGLMLILGGSKIRSVYRRIPYKAQTIIIVINVAVLTLVLFHYTILFYTDLQLNTSFEQRLTVLAPEISDQDYKEIKALWASMDSRGDFLALNAKMENLAAQNNVEIPRLLLP